MVPRSTAASRPLELADVDWLRRPRAAVVTVGSRVSLMYPGQSDQDCKASMMATSLGACNDGRGGLKGWSLAADCVMDPPSGWEPTGGAGEGAGPPAPTAAARRFRAMVAVWFPADPSPGAWEAARRAALARVGIKPAERRIRFIGPGRAVLARRLFRLSQFLTGLNIPQPSVPKALGPSRPRRLHTRTWCEYNRRASRLSLRGSSNKAACRLCFWRPCASAASSRVARVMSALNTRSWILLRTLRCLGGPPMLACCVGGPFQSP